MEHGDYLSRISECIQSGPFQDSWQSLERYSIPPWFRDAKLGIFIHWGPYSVPAFGNEWYSRNMYCNNMPEFEHHRKTWGPQSKFGYKDFIPLLTAARFDPAEWAELFLAAGAKYVVPVAEHHDGFAMYDCGFSRWTAAKMGPKRDVIGELAGEVRRRGLIFGASSHRAEHWWFMNGGRAFNSDVNDPLYEDFYGPARSKEEPPDESYMDDWLCRCCEIVDKYRPRILYFDWWIEEPAWTAYLARFAAYYYNRAAQWSQDVVINFKNRAFPDGTAVFDMERGRLSEVWPVAWQSDTSISNNSWGYIEGHDYKSAGNIIEDLVDVVAKNGSMLLNIGPKPDGTIPETEAKILRGIGEWLSANGEAVYGSRPWKVFAEGPTQAASGAFTDAKRSPYTPADYRFTRNGDSLYAISLARPGDGRWLITSLASGSKNAPPRISRVELLGNGGHGEVTWNRGAEGLVIQVPAGALRREINVFRVSP